MQRFGKIGILSILCVSLLSAPLGAQTQQPITDDEKSKECAVLDSNPIPITRINTSILYPAEALKLKIGGRVQMIVKVDKFGNVIEAKAIGSHPSFESPKIINAVKARKYKPAIKNCEPIEAEVSFWIMFSLK